MRRPLTDSQLPPSTDGSSRAVATQLDFLAAATIFILSFIGVIIVGSSVIAAETPEKPAEDLQAGTAANIIADDLLVDDPNSALVNETCAEAFFTNTAHTGCGYDDWGEGEEWVRGATLVDQPNFYVEITEPDGTQATIGGTELKTGTNPNVATDSATASRYVTLNTDQSSGDQIHILRVITWS